MGELELTPTQAKVGMRLLEHVIGSPPQEVTADINVSAELTVRALVARVGVERARTALEQMQATQLIPLLTRAVEEGETA